jgi:opacity protein-like surface antigen
MKQALLQVKVRGMAMKTTQMTRHFVLTGLLALLIPIVLSMPQAYAESYVAGQFGVTLPSIGGGLSNNDLTGIFIPGSTVSDQALTSSILYGAKVGHYFTALPWVGLEAEIFNTTPHVKQQSLEFFAPSGATVGSVNVEGLNFRVLTLAPLNLTLRYHKTRLQPYIAIGPGIFLARLKDPSLTSDNTQSDTAFGLNAQAGLRYYVTRHFTVFMEGKFNHAQLNFAETPPGSSFNLFGFDSTYNMIHVAFGLSYNF